MPVQRQELESYFPYFDTETLQEAYRNILKIRDSIEDYYNGAFNPEVVTSMKYILDMATTDGVSLSLKKAIFESGFI